MSRIYVFDFLELAFILVPRTLISRYCSQYCSDISHRFLYSKVCLTCSDFWLPAARVSSYYYSWLVKGDRPWLLDAFF
jgi:hypothetical protein